MEEVNKQLLGQRLIRYRVVSKKGKVEKVVLTFHRIFGEESISSDLEFYVDNNGNVTSKIIQAP